MAAAWHDFGQRVDLTARIREILLNYPEGTSIFKELIQVPIAVPIMHTMLGMPLPCACLQSTSWFVQPAGGLVLNVHIADDVASPWELLQNADDAGARTISFCLDEQQHGVDRLAYDGLAPLQVPCSPALQTM